MTDPFYRYFLAFLPPAELRPLIAGLRDSAGPMASPVKDAHLHLTLAIVRESDTPDRDVAGLVDTALRGHDLHACLITLGRIAATPYAASLLTTGRLRDLRALQAALVQRLIDHALPPVPRKLFMPHVTLGYGPDARERRAIDPILWWADRIVLIESHVGRTIHRPLGEWHLPRLMPRQYAFDFDLAA